MAYNVTEQTWKARVGEVQANPTANTLLGRLKDIVTALTSMALGASSAIIGSTKDAGDHYTPSRALVSSADISSAVDLTAAPTAGQKIVITDLFVSVGTAMRVDFLEETTGTVILSGYFPANGGIHQITPRAKLKLDTADKKLRVQGSAAGNVRIVALYRSEA